MIKLLLLTSILFLGGCRDYADVVVDTQGATVEWYSGGVDSVKVTPWKVGPQRKQLLSMGARVKFSVPPLKEDDIEKLAEKYNVDSWLVTLMVSGVGRKERLASFYVPLFKKSGRSGAMGVSSVESGYLDLFYSAASISMRLRELECPGLEHRYLLEDVSVRELPQKRQLFVLSGMEQYNYLGKVEKLDFQRNVINLGKNIVGEYQLLFSLFSYKEKRVLSNQVVAPQVIVLGSENIQSIKGCEDLKTPPLNKGGPGNIQDFKFGR